MIKRIIKTIITLVCVVIVATLLIMGVVNLEKDMCEKLEGYGYETRIEKLNCEVNTDQGWKIPNLVTIPEIEAEPTPIKRPKR